MATYTSADGFKWFRIVENPQFGILWHFIRIVFANLSAVFHFQKSSLFILDFFHRNFVTLCVWLFTIIMRSTTVPHMAVVKAHSVTKLRWEKSKINKLLFWKWKTADKLAKTIRIKCHNIPNWGFSTMRNHLKPSADVYVAIHLRKACFLSFQDFPGVFPENFYRLSRCFVILHRF